MHPLSQAWLDGLKAGDPVGIFDYGGAIFRHEGLISKRTPTGRLVDADGSVYKPNGHQIGSRSDRCLRPIPNSGVKSEIVQS